MIPFNPAVFDSSHWPGLSGLAELYRELDLSVARALETQSLSCPGGCIACCSVPPDQIEASVFELLPLAMEAWKTGRAPDLLENLGDNRPFCVFLERVDKGNTGRCTAYAWRPLMCRLFGFSIIQGTKNGLALYACGILKNKTDGIAWTRILENGKAVPLPLAHAWRLRVHGLNPRHSLPLVGINQALREALGIAGLRFRLEPGDQAGLPKLFD